jgi:hypothetical protein
MDPPQKHASAVDPHESTMAFFDRTKEEGKYFNGPLQRLENGKITLISRHGPKLPDVAGRSLIRANSYHSFTATSSANNLEPNCGPNNEILCNS